MRGRYGPQDRRAADPWARLLNNARLERKLTQACIAAAAGVSQPLVSAVERGRYQALPRSTVLIILDKYFGSSFDAQLLRAICDAGLLEGVGGAVELAESPWSALLKEIRERKGLSVADVAKASSVPKFGVELLERGELRMLSKANLAKVLSQYYGTPRDEELLRAMETVYPNHCITV